MSDIAYELAQYLDDADFGTLGTDIYVGQMPPATNGIFVQRIGGQLNNYVPIEESAVNVYAINTSSSSAITSLESIKRFIHRMHSTNTANTKVYTFLVIGDIEDLSRDENSEKVYKLTIQAVYKDAGIIS